MITCAAELTDGGYRVDYVADQPLTPTHQGLPLVANTTWPALEPHDLVVVPGWNQVVPDPLNEPQGPGCTATPPPLLFPSSTTGDPRCRFAASRASPSPLRRLLHPL